MRHDFVSGPRRILPDGSIEIRSRQAQRRFIVFIGLFYWFPVLLFIFRFYFWGIVATIIVTALIGLRMLLSPLRIVRFTAADREVTILNRRIFGSSKPMTIPFESIEKVVAEPVSDDIPGMKSRLIVRTTRGDEYLFSVGKYHSNKEIVGEIRSLLVREKT